MTFRGLLDRAFVAALLLVVWGTTSPPSWFWLLVTLGVSVDVCAHLVNGTDSESVVWPGWATIRASMGERRSESVQSAEQGRSVSHVYVAGPCTSSGTQVDNLRNALEAAERLHYKGFVPFVPHLVWSWELLGGDGDQARWYEYTLDWLKRCDAVLRIPGESRGADAEVEIARDLGIPVFYDLGSLDEARDSGWFGVRRGLARIARDVSEWQATQGWTDMDPRDLIMGMQEELGELCQVYVKRSHGIRADVAGRTDEEFQRLISRELADVLIYALGYCTVAGIDPGVALVERWTYVKNRNPDRPTEPPSTSVESSDAVRSLDGSTLCDFIEHIEREYGGLPDGSEGGCQETVRVDGWTLYCLNPDPHAGELYDPDDAQTWCRWEHADDAPPDHPHHRPLTADEESRSESLGISGATMNRWLLRQHRWWRVVHTVDGHESLLRSDSVNLDGVGETTIWYPLKDCDKSHGCRWQLDHSGSCERDPALCDLKDQLGMPCEGPNPHHGPCWARTYWEKYGISGTEIDGLLGMARWWTVVTWSVSGPIETSVMDQASARDWYADRDDHTHEVWYPVPKCGILDFVGGREYECDKVRGHDGACRSDELTDEVIADHSGSLQDLPKPQCGEFRQAGRTRVQGFRPGDELSISGSTRCTLTAGHPGGCLP